MLTVATANVNGVRAAARKGFTAWLDGCGADVVCLQEVRAEPAELPAELREPPGWCAAHAPAPVKGRAGVAVLSRTPPSAVRTGGVEAGRWIEVDLPGVVVASMYVPKGEAGTERQVAKERFLDGLAGHLAALRRRAAAGGRDVLVCGDWNIAHREADLKNARANRGSAGFLPAERAWLDRLYAEGWVDVVRALEPDGTGPYTWWSYRGRAFDNDAGWRIDYQVATPGLAAAARTARVDRAASYAERWSDHAPVVVTYAWPAEPG